MKYKAVIFDLDGTLLNTITDLTIAINRVLGGMGFSVFGEDVYKKAIGEGLLKLAQRILPKGVGDIETVRKFGELMFKEYAGQWDKNTRPYDGIPDVLKKLAASGIKMAVLTNRPDEFTKLLLKRFFPEIEFDAVVGAKNAIVPKPEPKEALKIARELKVTPGEVVFVGDTKTDMETARAAGMFPVGVLWGFRDREELVESGAAVVIKTPGELFSLF